jgi:hypothetical protein
LLGGIEVITVINDEKNLNEKVVSIARIGHCEPMVFKPGKIIQPFPAKEQRLAYITQKQSQCRMVVYEKRSGVGSRP